MQENTKEYAGNRDAPQVRGVAARSESPGLDGDLAVAEDALSALNQAWEAAIDATGSTVPPAQLRAVLAIATAAPVSLTALARRLRASVSAASRLCDRLQQAGLIARDPSAPDRRGVLLSLTPAGASLAAWVREQRQASLAAILAGMTPAARRALIDGLCGLPAAAPGGDVRPGRARSGRGGKVRAPARMDEAMTSQWELDSAGLFTGIDGSVGRSLCALTRAVTDHVPHCFGASATLWEIDAVVAMGASNADLAAVAEQQFIAGGGPIIAALRTGEAVVTPDILREGRWPEFAVAAMAAGVRAQATVVHDYSLMTLSLTLYAAAPGTLDLEALSPATLLAKAGVAAMAGAAEQGQVQRTAQQLDAAIRSRAIVEQARQLVMQKLGCGPDEAFERLWRMAQQQRRRVAEVARRMVDTSESQEEPRAAV
jgi:DNA-binding MarR family transcriptional regulator